MKSSLSQENIKILFGIFERTVDGSRITLRRFPGVQQVVCLFEPYPQADWAIYSYYSDCEEDIDLEGFAVSKTLAELLDGGTKYPPALALARERAFHITQQHAERETCLEELADLLQEFLSVPSQESGFVISRAVESAGDVFRGSYYWIVGYDPKRGTVEYVTDEYYILEAPVSCFEVAPQRLAQLVRANQ